MPDDTRNVRFERLDPRDEEAYVDFLAAAYKDQFNSEFFADRGMIRKFWRWQYLENPSVSTDKPFVWLCKLNGRMIAQACVMPVNLKVNAGYLKAGWCQNLIILPEFRNMSLGYFLLRHAIEESAKAGVDVLMVGGTNDNSYALLKNLGFSDLGLISRNVKISLFDSSRNKDGGIEVEEIDNFGLEFNRFWEAVSERFECIVKRDANNLKWRFVENPYWRYKILCASSAGTMRGYAVLRESNLKGRLSRIRVGAVSDIMFDPEDRPAASALIGGISNHFRGRTNFLRCDILSDKMERVLRSAGYINIKSSNRFLALPLAVSVSNSDIETIKNRGSWHLTHGDSDLDIF